MTLEREIQTRLDAAKAAAKRSGQLAPVDRMNHQTEIALWECAEELRRYCLQDDCDVDGAPDSDNTRHSQTCRWCWAQTCLLGLSRALGLSDV